MRIWRDIPTTQAIVNRLRQIPNFQAVDSLPSVLRKIDAYHAIKKDDVNNILPRKNALEALSDALAAAVRRVNVVASPAMRHRMVDARDIDTLLDALDRRAHAKAHYLGLLRSYYMNNMAELMDPKSLMTELAQPRVIGRTLPLVPGVRLEARDPLHRGWEMVFDDAGAPVNLGMKMHQVFAVQWYKAVKEGRCNQPLFVYLEATEFCLDREPAHTAHVVQYKDVRQGDQGVYQLRVDAGGQVQQQLLGSSPDWKPFDTQWVQKADSDKGGSTHSLAYNWLPTTELFADLHNPNRGREWRSFHHSSFTSGGDILCAGMISGLNGKIVYLDNDSGHYQPTSAHLQRLVKHLYDKGAFHPAAQIRDLDPALKALPAHQGIRVEDYVVSPTSLPPAAAPIPPAAAAAWVPPGAPAPAAPQGGPLRIGRRNQP
jgi:hypothetical protein